MTLPDPRLYPRVNPQNPVIRQLMSLMTERDAAQVAVKRQGLRQLIAELLGARDHYGLNGAITQVPSQEAWFELWQCIRDEVEQSTSAKYAVPFAIPLVLVAGFKGETSLPSEIDGAAALSILREHGVVAADADVFLSGALLAPDLVAAINPAQIAEWRETISEASRFPIDSAGSAIAIKDEVVALRYLVGVAIQQQNAAPAIKLGGQVGAWGMPLAQLISDTLKTNGVTLFPIPRPPMSWLAAQDAGRVTQLETRLQVMTSNALRSIRTKGRTPVVTVAAHENAEIRITFSTTEDPERWEGYVWPLAANDQVAYIEQYVAELMRECRVDSVKMIGNVQPVLDTDGLPLFITAHNLGQAIDATIQ
ncbi:hypothetical protein HQ393_05875 [Chitinibacter bivalviorum]|uniref:Uncharacterized protein n=1 Tax=Chitinibacter bivalviorum TaxID=2739434 RepID=A0A7H9BK10_9NEIS|nr:hypothetical protein [Chitinibacter bivalviorum]QLG87824.1 hypothetical protein HQ393_05875 [Chitinibacter bivalviorum]